MKKFPIGIQNLQEIIEDNYYYIDKTKYVHQLVNAGKYYFLSRPRRFGKSLFVDTLKEAFRGNKELFKDLYLEDKWDWNRRYPVIHVSFGSGVDGAEHLINDILFILNQHAREYEVELREKFYNLRLKELIIELYRKYKERVVILVDEYDKPILDKIEDKVSAERIRDILRNFYSVIKDSDAYIKFVFITGVTKFNKVSIFSGMNQLRDITLDGSYSGLCGYTEEEMRRVFADRLAGIDMSEVRRWYNGYNWLGESVYNPYDVLLLLSSGEYHPYWFQTGTPTFLIKLIREKRYYLPEMESIEVDERIMESFDIDNVGVESLLFQTGYLTIKEVLKGIGEKYYILSYPNYEVKISLNKWLLRYLTNIDLFFETRFLRDMRNMMSSGNVVKMVDILRSFFSSIPYEWYMNNRMNEYEGYYASVVYALFSSLGMEVRCEESMNKGRVDMVVKYEDKVYVIEFKVIRDEERGGALRQIKEKRYYEKYIEGNNNKIYLIGIEFDERERNIINMEYEKIH